MTSPSLPPDQGAPSRLVAWGVIAAGLIMIAAAAGSPGITNTQGFMPHGFCITWQPGLLALHVVSDLAIGLAYLSIPVTLVYFVRRRRDLPFPGVFLLFGLFIVSCGLTHFIEVWTIWQPYYWISGAVKAVTAVASVGTAGVLLLMVKPALNIPSPAELRRATDELRREVAERAKVETQLREAQGSLEERVAVRTRELAAANEELARINDDLARHREQLRETLDSIGDAVVAVDAQGRITLFNRRAELLTGHRTADALGRPVDEVVQAFEEASGQPSRMLDAAMNAGARTAFDHSVLARPDGSRVPVEATVGPIHAEGQQTLGAVTGGLATVGAVGLGAVTRGAATRGTVARGSVTLGTVIVLRDVTQRKALESQRATLLAAERQLRERAERANRMKDEFVATISHELRNPINAMTGWIHLLRTGRLDVDASRDALERIDRNARAQARLIDDLLDVARVITDSFRIEPRLVDPVAVLTATLDAVRPAAQKKSIAVTLSADAPQARCMADPDRLTQAFTNLIGNAIKFTPQGGRIDLTVAVRDGELEIAVTDDGQGIDPAFLPHVFERFRQADASSSRTHQGLGLGLSIVRDIIQSHGGSVSAASAGVGQGARFVVRLPLQDDADGALAQSAGDSTVVGVTGAVGRLDGLSVVIVEDSDDAREMLAALLRTSGAAVRAYGSAAEAIVGLQQSTPSVLLADIGMPGQDGFALLEQVRQLRGPAATVPAIAVTAYASASDKARVLASGFQAHVAKPVEPAELVEVLRQIVHG